MKITTFRLNEDGRLCANVDDFGAVGDGVTDDLRAFQRAIRAYNREPLASVLQFSVGKTYRVSGHVGRLRR